jgi:hypothetical protein
MSRLGGPEGGDNDKAKAGLLAEGMPSGVRQQVGPSQLYHQTPPRDSFPESLGESSDNLTILRSQRPGYHNHLKTTYRTSRT